MPCPAQAQAARLQCRSNRRPDRPWSPDLPDDDCRDRGLSLSERFYGALEVEGAVGTNRPIWLATLRNVDPGAAAHTLGANECDSLCALDDGARPAVPELTDALGRTTTVGAVPARQTMSDEARRRHALAGSDGLGGARGWRCYGWIFAASRDTSSFKGPDAYSNEYPVATRSKVVSWKARMKCRYTAKCSER